ncbi:MAG: sugar ABC transporter permease, partial [Anaerolineales bacterium]|nr:sugar ABC transporter permease [Anaerolineales bacterium]
MATSTITQQERTPKEESWFQRWLTKEGSAYAFLSGYALMFIIFIVVPVLVAFFLSFTLFDTTQPPSFIGLKNYI